VDYAKALLEYGIRGRRAARRRHSFINDKVEENFI
jgi:hypothetical protein